MSHVYVVRSLRKVKTTKAAEMCGALPVENAILISLEKILVLETEVIMNAFPVLIVAFEDIFIDLS